MNCKFLAELLQLLFKRIPRKHQAIKNDCTLAVRRIQLLLESQPSGQLERVPTLLSQTLGDAEGEDLDETEPPEDDGLNEEEMREADSQMSERAAFVRLPEDIVDLVFGIYSQVNECQINLGLKTYELSLYLVVHLLATRQLGNEQNLRYFGDLSDLDIASNIIYKLSQFVAKHELMYAKAMLYTLGAALAIECVDDIQAGYRAVTCLVSRLFSHLFFVTEDGLQFATDVHVTSFFRRGFDNIYNELLQNCQFQFESPIVQNRNKLLAKLCIDQEMEYIVFIVFESICYYQFDFLYRTGKETNVESALVEITTDLFSNFKSKPQYGERLVKLLQKQFDAVNRVDSANLHSVEYYTYILVMIGKIMQYALETSSVDLYRIAISLVKQVHYQIIQYSQLRSQFFILFDTFVLYVIKCSSKIQFRIDALMSLVTLFLVGNQSQILDLYFTLYDLNGLPLITNLLKLLISLVNDQSIKISQPINNFKRYKVQQLIEFYVQNRKIVQSGWVKEDIQLTNLQDLVLIVFLKFLRCIQTPKESILQLPAIEAHFERQACILLFNASESPEKALNVFIKHGYCTSDRLSIINFLIENNREVDKAKIGQLLGGYKPLNIELLKTYTDYVFNNIIIEDENEAVYFISALRSFLSHFKTPGESQQIGRILLQFSVGFSGRAALPQTSAYILSYATLMLNTDIYNYSVKDKMSEEAFIYNTMRADPGFSQPFLAQIYAEIQQRPLSLEEIELARSEALYGELGYYCYELYIIQNVLKKQLFIDEKISVLALEENSASFEDVVTDDGFLACKTIYNINIPKTPRAESGGLAQKLIKQYEIKPIAAALLEFYGDEIYKQFAIYMYNNQIYRRFRFSNEIMFHLYRMAQVSADCQRMRSEIITRLLEGFFCYARQSYPLAELIYQLSDFQQQHKQYTTIEDRNEATNKIAKSISEELTMAFLLLVIIDNNVAQSAFDLALTAYFISMQNFNLVCSFLGRANSNIQIFSEQIQLENLQAMFDNDQIMLKYANEFQKFFVTFPLFYPSLMAKSGEFLYLLDFDKCFSSLVLIGELMLMDWDMLCAVTDKQFKSHLEQTYLFDFLVEFYVNYFVKYKQIFDQKTQLSADFLEIRNQFLEKCEALGRKHDDVSLSYFYKLVQHLGSALIMLRCYNKETRLQINLCRSIQSVVLNFFSQELQSTDQSVIQQVMCFLCHIERGTIVPQASLLNIDTITQLIPLIPIDYQNVDQFILFCHASLHRIVTYNIKVDEQLSCEQCHHAACEFETIAPVMEEPKYPVVYCKAESAWQECYQQIVILINTMGNKIEYLKGNAMRFVRNEIAILKQFYESKIAQIVLMSLNFALEYMCQEGQPKYTDALNLLASEIVIPNLAQFHEITDNDAYNTLTQHFFKIVHATDPYWHVPEIKTHFVKSVFENSLQPIVMQHKQAKEYTLFEQLTTELLVVFSSEDAENITSAKELLHEAFTTFVLLFSQKFPSRTNFQKLLEIDFYNLLQCQMRFQPEYEADIVSYIKIVFRLLLEQEELINDESDVFEPLFGPETVNLRQNYIYQAYESFVATLGKFPTLSPKVKAAFYRTVLDATVTMVQLANETSLYDANIMIIVDFFNLILSTINENSIEQTQFNKDIGFELAIQIMKFCLIFANQETSNQFLTMVEFSLEVTKRLIVEFSKDVLKCDTIHRFLIKSIRFNDSQVRENVIDCFEEYQSAVVEERAERQAQLAIDLRSVQVDDE